MSAELPEELHKIKGTRPTRAANFDEDLKAGAPKLPKGFDPESKVVFKRLVNQLEERRTCTPGDVEILMLYAELHSGRKRALQKCGGEEVVVDTRLDSNGASHEVLRKNPWLVIAQESEKQMHSILRDLGLTPSARKQVKPLGKPKDEPQDEMEIWAANRERGLQPVYDDDAAAKVADIPTDIP
jgi:P27 family predicted phage terminase small subunit